MDWPTTKLLASTARRSLVTVASWACLRMVDFTRVPLRFGLQWLQRNQIVGKIKDKHP